MTTKQVIFRYYLHLILINEDGDDLLAYQFVVLYLYFGQVYQPMIYWWLLTRIWDRIDYSTVRTLYLDRLFMLDLVSLPIIDDISNWIDAISKPSPGNAPVIESDGRRLGQSGLAAYSRVLSWEIKIFLKKKLWRLPTPSWPQRCSKVLRASSLPHQPALSFGLGAVSTIIYVRLVVVCMVLLKLQV